MCDSVVARTRKQDQLCLAVALPEISDNRAHQNSVTNGSGVKKRYSLWMRR